jgi:uncharacterized membrane protein YvbJ
MKEVQMESVKKTQFCAICGRNHDPKFTCASVRGDDALKTIGVSESKEKDTGSSFKELSKKTDKIMILIVIFIVLAIIVGIYIMQS